MVGVRGVVISDIHGGGGLLNLGVQGGVGVMGCGSVWDRCP